MRTVSADRGTDIAAQTQPVDLGMRDLDLTEGVGEMRAGCARFGRAGRANDRELAGQGIGAAQPVDLPAIRRAENGKDRAGAFGFIGRRIAFLQESGLAGLKIDWMGLPFPALNRDGREATRVRAS
jgi:hypothetical protein